MPDKKNLLFEYSRNLSNFLNRFCEIRLEQRTTKGNSSGRIMRLVPVFILETHNQTNYKCLPKFVQTDNVSLL